MDAAYTKKAAVVVLDDSEVRLIMQALDELRYSELSGRFNGSQLINLAGLSHEWLCMSQDMGSRKKDRVTTIEDTDHVMDKIVHELYSPMSSWEVY